MTAPIAPYEKRSSGAGKIFAIVLAVVVGVGILAALTCVGALVGFVKMGENLVEQQVQAELTAALAPHAGDVRSFDVNWTASIEYEEPDVMVYDVEGSLADGRVVTEHTSDGADRENVHWAVWVPQGAPPVAIHGEPPPKFLTSE